MKIAGIYSFKDGEEEITKNYSILLTEVNAVIKAVDASVHKVKVSKEKTMTGRVLYSPPSINKAFKAEFSARDWTPVRVACDYPTTHFVKEYKIRSTNKGAFREMDFVKDKLGIEVQFGKYAFMVYNVCAKMTIFRNLGHINCGIEIVPVKAFADDMSTGVSYFEQFVWDLENRGAADIDIPVLILGIDA
ncbi:MAG: restriction endonuclease [Blastocatellia bacterium]|nr:restriction endonuclease [Blastocatellia bacterium]